MNSWCPSLVRVELDPILLLRVELDLLLMVLIVILPATVLAVDVPLI